MCGIAGFIDTRVSESAETMGTVVESMTSTLAHRGPDSFGVWLDEKVGVAMGHRRLAIIDLSDAGNQPMVSSGGRYVLSYNGEVYNHAELRRDLADSGTRFRGSSDTEVLLEAISAWGLAEALKRSSGMFAFAVWDKQTRTLSLARDRMGEKPLYYGWAGSVFLFGSELKALHAHPEFSPALDRDAIALYLRYGYIPSPYSPFQGIRKLTPGTSLTIAPDSVDLMPDPERYWSLEEVVELARNRPSIDPRDVATRLDEVITESVGAQMVADVPLGAFLSGGVDSSTVVALMQAQSQRAVKTFSIGFKEQGYDEAVYAKQVAKHLGTDHTELYVTPTEAQEVIPKLPEIYDEPFGDSSQIPTFLVSTLARQDVTVALSGDGGDELFGGYPRYRRLSKTWRRVSPVPLPLRKFAGRGLRYVPASWWAAARRAAVMTLPSRLTDGLPSPRAVETLAGVLESRSPYPAYHMLVSHWRRPNELVRGGAEPLVPITGEDRSGFSEVTSWAMYVDALQYLPDDILTKVDRASMAKTLEVRVPLLDPKVVEFAWSLKPSMRSLDGIGKWPLRQVLYKYVPRDLVDRPKMGFGVPIHDWLRGSLRGWAESLLSEELSTADGLLDPHPVRKVWTEHINGRRDHEYPLWTVLQLLAWRRQWRV